MPKFTAENLARIRGDIQNYIPQLSINCVLFKFNGEELQIPVVQPVFQDAWMIPGGFIFQHEDIDVAAKRILYQQTQIDYPIMGQFGTFGSGQRNFANEFKTHTDTEFPQDVLAWISQRFVTIGYYSIVGPDTTDLRSDHFFENAQWIDIQEIDKLALDHALLVTEAKKVLCSELLRRPVLMGFLPSTFTIPDLQKLYEVILERPIDRGNFRQRILKSNVLIKVGLSKEKTKHRPAIHYRWNEKAYLDSLTQDVKLGF